VTKPQPTPGRDTPAGEPIAIELTGDPLRIDWLDGIYQHPLRVDISEKVWERIDQSRSVVEDIIRRGDVVYGLNTGFGMLCRKNVSGDQLEALQENLIISHAVGVGPPVPPEIVRWMMLFKIHALGLGLSGVTRAPVEALRRLLSADVLPEIPSQGSLGASGDLAPLAAMVLPLLARGRVTRGGESVSVDEALRHANVEPVKLAAKEGLALINGTQLMTAYGAALVVRAKRLLTHADVIAASSLDAAFGSYRPFDDRLHRIRPHVGAIETALNVRKLLDGSGINEAHKECDRVQDPYSLRCVPQVHGAARDAVRHTEHVIETEINSVTDNPIIFDRDTVISGGNFHGQPVALVLDYLAMAVAELANISERRIYLLLSGTVGLPSLLMHDTGLNSGFMLPQYTAAALVSENKILASPASVDSIPTSLGQEDHVSMGATAATKAWRVLENVETVLAIEAMCAAQALDFRAPLVSGDGVRAALAEIRKEISFAEADRPFGDDIQRALTMVRSQRIVRAVENAIGPLQ
jgi:histidine ammonia-lyase